MGKACKIAEDNLYSKREYNGAIDFAWSWILLLDEKWDYFTDGDNEQWQIEDWFTLLKDLTIKDNTMKTYTVIKDFINSEWFKVSSWFIVNYKIDDYIKLLINNWFIEEIKEEDKYYKIPKFKVWDKVVWDSDYKPCYMIIFELYPTIEWYIYNFRDDSIKFKEDELRKPTQEELDLYFN